MRRRCSGIGLPSAACAKAHRQRGERGGAAVRAVPVCVCGGLTRCSWMSVAWAFGGLHRLPPNLITLTVDTTGTSSSVTGVRSVSGRNRLRKKGSGRRCSPSAQSSSPPSASRISARGGGQGKGGRTTPSPSRWWLHRAGHGSAGPYSARESGRAGRRRPGRDHVVDGARVTRVGVPANGVAWRSTTSATRTTCSPTPAS
jgi:hypothetical protein